MLRALARVLNGPVMGFLALAALSTGLAPMLFALPPRLEQTLDIAGWLIIGAFALEYVVHLALAEDKPRYVRNPWRVVDALIILAPLASLLPFAPQFLRSSPALRVLRLARVIVFGARARRGLTAGSDMGIARSRPVGPLRVTELAPGGGPRASEWRELVDWAKRPDERWLHASNVDAARIKEIAQRVDLPVAMVEAALRESSYPRLESSERWAAFALSLPGAQDAPRTPVLLLAGERHLLSLSLHAIDLQSAPRNPELPWGARCAVHVIRHVLNNNEALAARVERELSALETLPAQESPERFFEAVSRLKRKLALAKGDLWRLKNLLAMLAERRRELPGL